MKKILITGGSGDLSQGLKLALESEFEVLSPSRQELDVTSIDSVKRYFSTHNFDIVINCAGKLYSSLVTDSDPLQWIEDINVNLIGTYLVCKFALVSNRKTKIINISSTAAYANYKDWTSYCASKAGVMKLSLGLFDEGLDIIVMCPGAIDTKLRNGLSIPNNNVMDITEGIAPILDAVNGQYKSGEIIFYRKGDLEVRQTY
ncbi:SDR family NAD(P)-dependent oxidoreductase [Shewanella donghaensis]|uniref:SDR family NAD(P)-dependent oxidoreductase n=1 Tax=Shewanella donghaensis TaxID=238836 RepID=UPI001183EEB9|nr:SDR family oxidoreductase [Shewanella donghaensis]